MQSRIEPFWGTIYKPRSRFQEVISLRSSKYSQTMRAFTIVALAVTVGVAMARPEPYGHGGQGVQPGPAVEYAYPAVPPVAKCGHNLLISCNPHHTAIPCSHGHAGGGDYGGHHEAPAAPEHGDQYRHKKWHKKKHHKHHHHHSPHYHRDASDMAEEMPEQMPMDQSMMQ